MTRSSVFAAFAAGWTSALLCASLIGGINVRAEGDDAVHVCVAANGVMRVTAVSAPCPPGQQSFTLKKWAPDSVDVPDSPKPAPHGPGSANQLQLEQLEKQVKALEDAAEKGALSNKVTAPFEVDDRAGKKIFYVEEGNVILYNATGAEVVHLSATDSGGTFQGKSATGTLVTTVGAGAIDGVSSAGLRVRDGGILRTTVGTSPDGNNYVAQFNGRSGMRAAGIGQTKGGQGVAYVADAKGNVRGVLRIDTDGTGLLAVNGVDGTTVGSLGEDKDGGVLDLRNTKGTMMVLAGTDEGGFGVVRAGPESFKPGLGLLGLPGSYIAGKPK
jgi:hypothetical protein